MSDDDNEKELKEKIKALMLRKYGDTSRESMEKMFRSYDKDRSGEIDSDELEKLLKDAEVGNGITRGMWVSGIIKKLDKDGDKSISWREFDAVINSNN